MQCKVMLSRDWQVLAMTSRSCTVNTRASVLLVLVVADVVLVGRTTGLRVTHRRTPTRQQTSQQTGDHVAERTEDGDKPAALDASVLQTLGLQNVVGARRHRTPAAERVVVPEYMWQLYRRQRRANRERQHRRSAASGDYVSPSYYTANTIRSFVATPYSDTLLTGKCSFYSIEQLYLCSC